jgi:hypothetical protein
MGWENFDANGVPQITDTNTAGLINPSAGGYIAQDATASIAKESGGNLATIAALSKAEDAAAVDADPGIQVLAVRKDDRAAVRTSADGDYASLAQDRFGNLLVSGADAAELRRIQETAYLDQLAATMAVMLAADPYAARRGFEIR